MRSRRPALLPLETSAHPRSSTLRASGVQWHSSWKRPIGYGKPGVPLPGSGFHMHLPRIREEVSHARCVPCVFVPSEGKASTRGDSRQVLSPLEESRLNLSGAAAKTRVEALQQQVLDGVAGGGTA